MSLIEFALFFSVVIALYNVQKIKIILKEKGYPVDMLTGWMADYRHFKGLIEKEPDQKTKIKYQQILSGLLFSLGGLVFFAIMAFYNRM
jgi:ABC-type transport system substrate-binding protein